ncbi:MAG: hypothetical protein J5548_14765 [Prevotella sp.]|nr:hypothetical protein [Prevotella sp.]
MTIVVAALLFLGVVTALIHFFSKGDEEPVAAPPSCATCNGNDSRCEQECMLEAAVKEIEYFDDEELDAFQGRPSDSYTDSEAELFSEVLYTMRPEEVAAWTRSLTLRGINVPNQLKDELFMLMEK